MYPFQICWLENDSEAIVSMIMMMTMMKMRKNKKTIMMMKKMIEIIMMMMLILLMMMIMERMMKKIWSTFSVHLTVVLVLEFKNFCSAQVVPWKHVCLWDGNGCPAWKIDGQCDAPPKIEHGILEPEKLCLTKEKETYHPKNPFLEFQSADFCWCIA